MFWIFSLVLFLYINCTFYLFFVGSIFGRPISGGFAALAAKAQAEAAGKPGDKKSDSKDFSVKFSPLHYRKKALNGKIW